MTPHVNWFDDDESQGVPANDLTQFMDAFCAHFQQQVECFEEIVRVIRECAPRHRPELPGAIKAMMQDGPTLVQAPVESPTPLPVKPTMPATDHAGSDHQLIVEALKGGPARLPEILATAKALGYRKEYQNLASYISIMSKMEDGPVVRLARGVYALRGEDSR